MRNRDLEYRLIEFSFKNVTTIHKFENHNGQLT